MGSPVHLKQPIYGSHTVIDDSREEYGESVESETYFPTRHYFIDAVIEQSDHVDQRHQKSASTDDGRTVVDEVEKLDIIWVFANSFIVHVLGDVCNDEHTQVVHLGWDAEGVD